MPSTRYRYLSVGDLQAIAGVRNVQAADSHSVMELRLLDDDIKKLANEKGIKARGTNRGLPRIPSYNGVVDEEADCNFVLEYSFWSVHNREILFRHETTGTRVIKEDEFERLKAYVQAEDDFVDTDPRKQESAITLRKWHDLLKKAEDVGLYTFDYRKAINPSEDPSCTRLFHGLEKGIKEAKENYAVIVERRERVAREEAEAAEKEKKEEQEAAAAAAVAAARAELRRRKKESGCCIMM